jgi:hypothetical protein
MLSVEREYLETQIQLEQQLREIEALRLFASIEASYPDTRNQHSATLRNLNREENDKRLEISLHKLGRMELQKHEVG